jgi:predicted Zn finger-like uncharacterized protein
MKIVCENCATKYSIADEKVVGKTFKLRCKKCSHTIVVKGTPEGEPSQASAAPPSAGVEAAAEAGPAQGGQDAAVWHLVIDGGQVGPVTADEVRSKFAAGQVDRETYVWRDGYEGWRRLAEADEFGDIGAPSGSDEATRKSQAADLFRDPSYAPPPDEAPTIGDMGRMGLAILSPPGAGTGPAHADDSYAQPRGGGAGVGSGALAGGMAGSGAMAAAGAEPGVDVKAMTGTRREDSVLFSLNNLQALASGGGAPAGGGMGPVPSSPTASAAAPARPGYANSQTEGSGLIDIRAMAAQTLSQSSFAATPFSGSSKPDELPLVNDAPLFSPVAPAVLMPTAEPQGMPKWVWGLIAAGGVGVVAMLGVLIWVIRTPTPQPTPPPGGETQPKGVAVEPLDKDKDKGSTPEIKPAAQKDEAVAAATPAKGKEPEAADDRKRKDKDRAKDKDKGKDKPGKEPAMTQPTPPPTRVETPPPPPPVKQKPAKPKDDLDALLDSASPGGSKPKGETVKKDAPEQLSLDTIKSTLKGANGAVQACKDQFKTPGTYMVKFVIGKNGRVSDASVPGKSGDPTAECVAKAVKGVRFPELSGDPQSVTYPFILR